MGLRCLIGHDYGETQTSRDRTQRGKEVVVTVTEYRECSRCGHRRVLSENKEVKAESTEPDDATAEAAWAPDDQARDPTAGGATSPTARGPTGGTGDEPMTAAEDDGVILDDDPATEDRGSGEWPEAEVAQEDEPIEEHDPWPEEATGPEPQEPQEPEPPGPDEDPLEVGQGGETEPDTDAEATDQSGEPAETAPSSADPDRSTQPRPDNRDTEFVCPDCGENWPTRNSSLRPGDICPECRQGYLDERVVQ